MSATQPTTRSDEVVDGIYRISTFVPGGTITREALGRCGVPEVDR